jgi:DNA-binding transcriptional MerR regulator
MKRRGNRRYYQHHEVLMIRRIRDLLYDQGFTISGARNQLQESAEKSSSSVVVSSSGPQAMNGDGMAVSFDLLYLQKAPLNMQDSFEILQELKRIQVLLQDD